MTQQVTIIGAGWAGLTAAVELCRRNIPVTVYESSKHAGGRARSLQFDNYSVDNGQHLMIGAYHQMLATLSLVGVEERDVFLRIPQHLKMLDINSGNAVFQLKLPRLPYPFHLLSGIANCPSLHWHEKLVSLYRFNRLLKTQIDTDLPVSQWLNSAKLPRKYIDYLLKPLCLAALTTHPDIASARAFQNVLRQTFNGPSSSTDLLIPRTDLGQVFPAAAIRFIESHGGKVLLQHRLKDIHIKHNQVESIQVNQETIPVDQLILATPPETSRDLLSMNSSFSEICKQLEGLNHEPVTTVYLKFKDVVRLDTPMLGVLNATSEWIFERHQCGQPDLLAVVISAAGEHMHMDKPSLVKNVLGELGQLLPDLPDLESSMVIREKRATFQCTVDVDQKRPGATTPVSNLHLCGDYVYIEKERPGLPSTLEGAMRSGKKCAESVICDTEAE